MSQLSDVGRARGRMPPHGVSSRHTLPNTLGGKLTFRRCLYGFGFCYHCGEEWKTCDCQDWYEQGEYDEVYEDYEEEDDVPDVHADVEEPVLAYDTWDNIPEEEYSEEEQPETPNPDDSVWNDTAGEVTDDVPVFGPLAQYRWEVIDRQKEAAEHRSVCQGTWSWVSCAGTCQYCRDHMEHFLMICSDCRMHLCRDCSNSREMR